MDVQSTIIASRLSSVKAIRDENARLKAENNRLKFENSLLERHFDFALTAAADLKALPKDGRFIIIDGWNILLGDGRTRLRENAGEFGVFWQAKGSVKNLISAIEKFLKTHQRDYIWLILDGHDENVFANKRYRVSYTGGLGLQRADRMIVDFVRMAHFRDDPKKIFVVTADRRLLKDVKRAQSDGCAAAREG